MQDSQPPTVKVENDYGVGVRRVMSHPAFGQISASRVQGGTNLYASDFEHRHFVRVEITFSEKIRSLSTFWYHNRDHVVTLDMSEAQWASFVSCMNVGTGTPCTIVREGNRQLPGIELVQVDELFETETDEALEKATAAMDAALAAVESELAKVSKKKRDAVVGQIRKAKAVLTSSLPFLAERMGEHWEQSTEKAKSEVNAYMLHAINSAGLDALKEGAAAPLQIEGGDDPGA